MNDMTREELRLKKLFNYLWIEMVSWRPVFDDKNWWHLKQLRILDQKFYDVEDLHCSVEGKPGTILSLTSNVLEAKDLLNVILGGRDFWWKAKKKSDQPDKKSSYGTLVVTNPFSSCGSLDEALIRADVLFGGDGYAELSFYYDNN